MFAPLTKLDRFAVGMTLRSRFARHSRNDPDRLSMASGGANFVC